MENDDFKILYQKLTAKVKLLRALQKRKETYKNWFPLQERKQLYRVQKEVDDMLRLDPEGQKVFVKNNR